MRRLLLAPLALVCMFACGGSGTPNVFATPDGGGGGNDGGILGGNDGGIVTGDGCSDAAKLIYVLSAENDLYSFQPLDKKFTKIGPLGCKTSMTPNSMAISRDAVAWVNYVQADTLTGTDTDGTVFKVSTKDASCQPTS